MPRAGIAALVNDGPDTRVVGEEAVRVAAAMEPEVIVVDIAMPEVDGIKATQRIYEAMVEAPEAGLGSG